MCSPRGLVAAEIWHLETETALRHLGKAAGVRGACGLENGRGRSERGSAATRSRGRGPDRGRGRGSGLT